MIVEVEKTNFTVRQEYLHANNLLLKGNQRGKKPNLKISMEWEKNVFQDNEK